ncbi:MULTISPECIES: hypothetical protein [unclassified Mesorhizobium]|uniref:hypothetical protein n=1 Tax=unclassified Mesorhizobium TaxID=325217 RepID=UPI000BB0AF07|nr:MULTISPECIES: hypothetical protein [unclassified Mesorhizobium]AZO08739.1 hypothetical protein EJ074_06150 [Mesorhizobium sp. M3A.F.Ca.ET.080.04.2.1]PBB84112.1 hypothetical protein CK216_25405 [Mesorhizobium sp. WSM3876]RWB72136.1 MAG: hypothetical protein EOQ49_12905 [Mesorhizobium sp.]RWB83659.1 MAG: hypothetical protein EOQ52_25975 [Mesorhizobium sp.]RWE22738.1 MAG: hypothetical protein EOS41_23830 [Mesorhizobium sp.]
MLHEAPKTDARPPVIAARRAPPALRQCCDNYICPTCSQVVELTDFRQVVWHQQPGHQPMQLED